MSTQVFDLKHGARGGRRACQTGFTLIELMIVMTVVAILVSIAYPAYNDSVRKARRAQAKADLVELTQRADRFHTVNNSYAGFWSSVPAADKQSPRDGIAFYLLTREASDTGINDFVLSATPQSAQTSDTGCGKLTINQAGAKTASGTMGLSRCW